MAREYSKTLFNSARKYVEGEGWKSAEMDMENGRIGIDFNLKSKLKKLKLVIIILDKGITVYGIAPFSADNESMDAVSEFVARANYGLNYGNFEIDYRDGEVRYKSNLRCAGTPNPDDIEFTVDLPLLIWEQYGNAFLSVLIGGENPESAVAAAER